MDNHPLISELYLIPEPRHAPEPFIRAYRGLSPRCQGNGVPWHLTLPEKAYKSFQRDMEAYRSELDGLDLRYLNEVYNPTEEIFDYLKPARIRVERYEQYSTLDATGHIMSFKPDEDGYAATVRYSRTATLTGRLKTVAGPMLLHLPKVYRSVLASRWDNDGAIISLDYKSLEPRVLLSSCGRLPEEDGGRDGRDIYADIKLSLFADDHTVSRDIVKQIVLAELFGAGIDSIKDKLQRTTNDVEAVIGQIRSYFDLDAFKEKLYREWISNKQRYITNFYGRRIKTETAHTLVNHYVQSTAVDVALLGFKNILGYLSDIGRLADVVPLFILHDAIILDVRSNAFSLINGLCRVGATDIKNLENTTFYMSADKEFATR